MLNPMLRQKMRDRLTTFRKYVESKGSRPIDSGSPIQVVESKKASGAPTADERASAEISDGLESLLSVASAAEYFWGEGNHSEAIEALEDVMSWARSLSKDIETAAQNAVTADVEDDSEDQYDSDLVEGTSPSGKN